MRQASLAPDDKKRSELNAAAERQLQKLVSSGSQFAAAARKLWSLVKYREHPEIRVRELATVLSDPNANDNLRQDLIDYVWLMDRFEDRVIKEQEKRKQEKNAASAPSPTAADDRNSRYEAVERGELISIYISPKNADGTPDYARHGSFFFKADAPESEVLQVVESEFGRKLSPTEGKELSTSYGEALKRQKYLVSPNHIWDVKGMPKHEGCDYDCKRPPLDVVPEFLRADDLSDWIFTVQSADDQAYDHAVAKWTETGSSAWLAAAFLKADNNSPQLEKLVRDGTRVEHTSPSFPTIAFNRIRLKLAAGDKSGARKLLDEVLNADLSLLPLSAQNQFREQRMGLSDNANEFLKFSERRPVAFYDDGNIGRMTDLLRIQKSQWSAEYYEQPKEEYERETEQRFSDLLPWDERQSFDTRTLDILNWHFPLASLAQAARSPALPEYLQRQLVLAVWTRAVLLKNDGMANEIAPSVLKLAPEMEPLFKRYLSAKTQTEKQRAALFAILNFPSLSPFVVGGVPEFTTAEKTEYYFETSWWCKQEATEYSDEGREVPKVVPKPGFLNAEQLAIAEQERAALTSVSDAKSFLGKAVIAWARSAPADERIPEALFIAVRANESYKYGCGGWDADDETRKTAESILRKRYPRSPWTAKLETEESP